MEIICYFVPALYFDFSFYHTLASLSLLQGLYQILPPFLSVPHLLSSTAASMTLSKAK